MKHKLVHTGGHSLIKATLLYHQKNADELKLHASAVPLGFAIKIIRTKHWRTPMSFENISDLFLWLNTQLSFWQTCILSLALDVPAMVISHFQVQRTQINAQTPWPLQYTSNIQEMQKVSRTGQGLHYSSWIWGLSFDWSQQLYHLPFNRLVIIPLRVLVYQQNYGAPVRCLKKEALRYAFLCALLALLDLRIHS